MPYPVIGKESLQGHVVRVENLRQKQRDLAKLEARLQKEKQFNRKVEVNAEIRAVKREMKALTSPAAAKTDK